MFWHFIDDKINQLRTVKGLKSGRGGHAAKGPGWNLTPATVAGTQSWYMGCTLHQVSYWAPRWDEPSNWKIMMINISCRTLYQTNSDHFQIFLAQTHLVVIRHTAIRRGSSDLWCWSPEVTGGHDARLSHTEAKDQVVTPQGDVVVTGACCASLLSIHWTAA